MSMSPEQIGYNPIEIKNPDHHIVYCAPDGKKFTDEIEYHLYMLSDDYTFWHKKRLKMIEFMRDNKEKYQLLEKFYNEEFKNKYDPEFSELSDAYKLDLSKTIHFNGYCLKHYFKQMITPLFNKLGLKLK